jgi:hypothetical protein
VANVAVVVILVVLIAYAVATIRRRRRGVVAERGISVGADLAALADAPRVHVREIRMVAPDRAEVVFAPEDDAPGETPLRFVVWLRRDEFGYDLLTRWQAAGDPIALVLPPGSHLVRLRSVESLQHLTLRRLDER